MPTLHGDVNWDEVGFYKWDPSQRKLSCGDEDLHVTLASAHIGQDPSRVHLMNNVSYDAATLGVPGLQTGQIQCKELFSNLCGVAATRLAFMELMQLMDAKFPKVAKLMKLMQLMYAHGCIYVCMYVCMYVCIYVCIYIYIYI